MKKLVFLCIALLLLPFTFVTAATAQNLYEVKVLLASQTDELKEQAIVDGFVQVLSKLSGNPQIANNPVIKANIQRADYFVQDYSYSPVTTSSSEYTLVIHYDSTDVNRLLKHAKVALWVSDRPLVLVWLAVTSKQQDPEIITSESPDAIYLAFNEQSKRIGLPLIFPMMDMDDMNQISIDDITNMEIPALKEAAKRYSPQAMLIGNMQETETGWSSQWQLLLDNKQWSWKITDKTSDGVISNALNQASQTIAKQYVGKPDDA